MARVVQWQNARLWSAMSRVRIPSLAPNQVVITEVYVCPFVEWVRVRNLLDTH